MNSEKKLGLIFQVNNIEMVQLTTNIPKYTFNIYYSQMNMIFHFMISGQTNEYDHPLYDLWSNQLQLSIKD